MKIAILGTRGIPNNYGGFEQFAEKLSVKLVQMGHRVCVYSPHYNSIAVKKFSGVEIVKVYSPERVTGPFANYIYDYLCLRNAAKNSFDIILECGYTSAPVSYYLCNLNRAVLITNMDGLEWKRSRWNCVVKKLILFAERLAAKKSHCLVADNIAISNYLKEKYNIKPAFIPYGAELLKEEASDSFLPGYGLKKDEYFLIIARAVPENSLEVVIRGVIHSGVDKKLAIVCNTWNKHARYLQKKYKQFHEIHFLGTIYDPLKLHFLRQGCNLYFHGHSVGGTNPSLLEAMASGCLICAHDNMFNRSVLGEDGFYFTNVVDIGKHISSLESYKKMKAGIAENNTQKIKTIYNWDNIAALYEKLFYKYQSPGSCKKSFNIHNLFSEQ